MRHFLTFFILIACCAEAGTAHAAPPRVETERRPNVAGLDIKNILPRRSFDVRKMGVNAFVNDPRFGSIRSQMQEVKNTLRLKHIRVLFNWNNGVQSGPNSAINFGFYDEIANNIPKGVNALVILNGLPSWMSNSANWIDGNPRKTFVEKWVKPVSNRYKGRTRIVGYQVWNEQNDEANSENDLLDVTSSPENYLEMLALARDVIKSDVPGKLVVNGATTALNQNFPSTIDYNEALIENGIETLIDAYAIHFYSYHLENFFRFGGVDEFMESVSKPIWVTESGQKGTTSQKDYVQRMWPFLLSSYPLIQRMYYYQFTEATPAKSTYGLKNLTPGKKVSDLYIYLRDR